jgi:site-specific recombinase XerD
LGDLIKTNFPACVLPDHQNPALVYLMSLQGKGRRTMRGTLEKIAMMLGYNLRSMPWHKLRFEHVQAIQTKLTEEGLAPATVNKAIAAIRGTLRAAWRLDLISGDEYAKAHDVRLVAGSRLPAGRCLSPEEIVTLFSTTQRDTTPCGVRDVAILALGYAAGLRRAEIASLDFDQITEEGEFLAVKVVGKGNKERIVYLNDGGLIALKAYVQVRGEDPGPLFYAGRKGGKLIDGQRITDQGVYGILLKRAKTAKVENVSPHDLRRSFVSNLLDLGVDLVTCANLAGHSNVQTTARYDRRTEDTKKRASKVLRVPVSTAVVNL